MSTDAHLEVELKFAATADALPPNLAPVLPGVVSESSHVHHLSAVYFDTEDLRLTRAKITLRRRTGGKDAGWHVKLPKQGATRMELQAGLHNADTPPAEILGPLRSLVRDLPLVPIAQVDNDRHETLFHDANGHVVAEFCDDYVTAWSLLSGGDRTTWREWEVEIGSRHMDRAQELLATASQTIVQAGAQPADSPSKLATALGDSIHNAPEPPSVKKLPKKSPAAAVVKALARNREVLLNMDPSVRRDAHDSIHQMRVATRELRSHMQSFDGIITIDPVLPQELKYLASVLGVARDAEVVGERFRNYTDVPLDDAARTRLTDGMAATYRAAHSVVVELLDSPRYFALLNLLDQHVCAPEVMSGKHKAAERVLASRLADAYARVAERHKKAVAEWSDSALPLSQREENFHNVRKAVKRLRYSAEAAGQATNLKTTKLYAACKKMQTILGDFQDCVTARDALLTLADTAHQHGEKTFTYGVLYQREHDAGLRALSNYDAAFARIRGAYKKLAKQHKL